MQGPLTNHARVLAHIAAKPDILMETLIARVRINERTVQNIMTELKQDGYIAVERVGRRNYYLVNKKLPLAHHIDAHRTIDDLIAVINQEVQNG